MYNRVRGLVGLGEGLSSSQLYMAKPNNTRSMWPDGSVPVGMQASYSQRLASLDATLQKAPTNNLEIIGQSPKRFNASITRPSVLSQYQFAEATAASKILPDITVNQKLTEKKASAAHENPRYQEENTGPQLKCHRALPKVQPDVETFTFNPNTAVTRLPMIDISNKVVSAPTHPPKQVTVVDRTIDRKADAQRRVPANHLPRATVPGLNKPEYVPPMLVSSSAPSMPPRHMPPMMLGVTAHCFHADHQQKYAPPGYHRRSHNLPPIDRNGKYMYPAQCDNTGEMLHPMNTAVSSKIKQEKKKKGSCRR